MKSLLLILQGQALSFQGSLQTASFAFRPMIPFFVL
jgi:hypothetical protein